MPTSIALQFSNGRQNSNCVCNLDFGRPRLSRYNFRKGVKVQTVFAIWILDAHAYRAAIFKRASKSKSHPSAIWILDAHAYRVAIFERASKFKLRLQFGFWTPTHIVLQFSNGRRNPNRVRLQFGFWTPTHIGLQSSIGRQNSNFVCNLDFGRPRILTCNFQMDVKFRSSFTIWILDAHAYRVAISKWTSKSKLRLQFGFWTPTHISNRRPKSCSSLKIGF